MYDESIRETAAQNTFMKFGTSTPKCRECTQKPVASTGDICPGCVVVIANREEYAREQEEGKRWLTLLVLILAVAFVATVTASVYQK